MLISKKPILLVSFMISLMMCSVFYFSLMAVKQIELQHQVTQDFYDHPFKVSTASARLENTLVKIRVNMLQLSRTTDKDIVFHIVESVGVNHFNARAELSIIQKGFLGDIARS
ncbi:MAG: hypothetical protein Q9M28_06695 [Mariprofundaceae bacterium]|nr:hypothetical protein [Mariprofundaceae bacterium]